MASFEVAKQFTKDLEGGFWNDPSAGYTYAGITAKYYPSWPGFARLQALGKKFFGGISKIPRYTKFKDEALEKLVHEFYHNRHWLKLVKGNQIQNQNVANIIYDFIVHKEYEAIAVINKVAKEMLPGVKTKSAELTIDVTTVFNTEPTRAYALIRQARIKYYRDHKKFSKEYKKSFIERVEKFPAVTVPNIKASAEKFSSSFLKVFR